MHLLTGRGSCRRCQASSDLLLKRWEQEEVRDLGHVWIKAFGFGPSVWRIGWMLVSGVDNLEEAIALQSCK